MLLFYISFLSWPGFQASISMVDIIAKGSTPQTNDRSGEERNALENAKRNAVEQVVAEILTGDTFSKNYKTIERSLLDYAGEFSGRHEVLQASTRNGQYHITLKVSVDRTIIKSKLSELGLMAATIKPRIAVLMVDKDAGGDAGQAVPGGAAQTFIANCFLNSDFVVLDLEQIKRNLEREELDALLSLDEEKASALGLRLNVDLLVTGHSQSQDAGDAPLNGFKAASSVVLCQVYFTDNGRLIASKSVNSNGIGVSLLQASTNAMEKASSTVCEHLAGKIGDFWRKQEGGSRTFTLVLSGASYQESRKIQDYLRSSSGVVSVAEREFNATQVVLDVSVNRKPIEDLLDALLSDHCPVSGWSLRLKSGNTLNLTRTY